MSKRGCEKASKRHKTTKIRYKMNSKRSKMTWAWFFLYVVGGRHAIEQRNFICWLVKLGTQYPRQPWRCLFTSEPLSPGLMLNHVCRQWARGHSFALDTNLNNHYLTSLRSCALHHLSTRFSWTLRAITGQRLIYSIIEGVMLVAGK